MCLYLSLNERAVYSDKDRQFRVWKVRFRLLNIGCLPAGNLKRMNQAGEALTETSETASLNGQVGTFVHQIAGKSRRMFARPRSELYFCKEKEKTQT